MSVVPRYIPAEVKAPAKVKKLPQRAFPPLWLRFLLMLQHSSSVFAFCTVVSALAVYGLTVYTPRLWNQKYAKLTALQRHERNLTATNETLKNELAQQAERPEAGLATPNPDQVIFLPSATDGEQAQTPRGEPKSMSESLPTAPASNSPLAY